MTAMVMQPSAFFKRVKDTFYLRSFGLVKVPLILFCSPVVEELTDARSVVRIPLNWRTKNHLGSLYFGALGIGADCVGGILAMHHLDAKKPTKFQLVFKDFKANFLKRPTEDVLFVCEDGVAVKNMVEQALTTGERQNFPLKIQAFIESDLQNSVADFELTLSIKKIDKKKS